jgi:hypothetical protein
MSKAAELANLIGNINAGGGSSNRNIFQNGAMNVSQRSVSETGIGSGAVDTYKTLDRVGIAHGNTDGRLTMTQTADGPSGFANCLKLACTTADTSIAAGEYLQLKFKFEGQDLQTIKKGTSDAVPLTVSFYVKGNGNATYMCELEDHDNSRNNQQQFAVTSSWNRVSLTFVADTTGAFDDDNALSLSIIFWLHAGSTYTGGTYTANTWTGSVSAANRAVGISSFFSSTSNTFFLTGMQVEVGQNPTEFEHEPIERTKLKCYRYYHQIAQYDGAGQYTFITGAMGASNGLYMISHPVEMRARPTIAYSGSANLWTNSTSDTSPSSFGSYSGTLYSRIEWARGSLIAGNSSWGDIDDATITISAEL